MRDSASQVFNVTGLVAMRWWETEVENTHDEKSSIAAPPPKMLTEVGDYELLQQLGAGGAGAIYKGRDKKRNCFVTLKLYPRGVEMPEVQHAAARLRHRHIHPIVEVGEIDQRAFIVTEFLPRGTNLAELISQGRMDPQQAAHIAHKVARAVQHVHDEGLIHRDLKPANILLDEEGEPRVTEFGLAQFIDRQELEQPGTNMGTPTYMSPEQAAGRTTEMGPQSDIYSLGVILFEMVTGQRPFNAESINERLQQVQRDEPIHPRRLNPKISRRLKKIILKCLRKDPDKRYASADELADDLQRRLRQHR